MWSWMSPYLWGFVVLILVYVLTALLSGSWSLLKIVEGADGRLSTSKFQWLFWTTIVLYGYVVMYVTRARFGYDEAMAEIPSNVLLAMGFSAGTLTAAKGITVGYMNSGKLRKTTVQHSRSLVQLVADDGNAPDLTKIQMIAWTLVAGFIYLSRVIQLTYANIHRDADLLQMPDIDKSLMLLMGLGQGTYLGKKITSMDTGTRSGAGGPPEDAPPGHAPSPS